MWARWVLSFTVAAALLVALVLFVNAHNTDTLATQSPSALARATREADIVVAQDQAPHLITLRSAGAPRAAFARAVSAEMNRRINNGTINGPLERVACAPRGERSGMVGFSCAATAGRVNYGFLGVVDVRARRLVYCKRDPPPVPSQPVPISRRCQI
jgi:hypothetical protein